MPISPRRGRKTGTPRAGRRCGELWRKRTSVPGRRGRRNALGRRCWALWFRCVCVCVCVCVCCFFGGGAVAAFLHVRNRMFLSFFHLFFQLFSPTENESLSFRLSVKCVCSSDWVWSGATHRSVRPRYRWGREGSMFGVKLCPGPGHDQVHVSR